MRFLLTFFLCLAASAQQRNLEIYWIDVEGGAATLLVSPSGESLLADTGNPGERDLKRIHSVLTQQAGLKKLDYLLTTHFHGDHYGAAVELSKLIPIGQFFDHGDTVESANPRGAQMWEAYKTAVEGKRKILKPGDRIPVKGLDLTVVTSNGEVIQKAINGGKSNEALCKDAPRKPDDPTENARSLGFLLTQGKFKFLDLGDLTWNKELDLSCPVNKVGEVSLFQATHHGFFNDGSGAPAHVWAVRPQVVVVNNGPRKGLNAPQWDTISKIKGLEAVWQGHLSLASDKAHNTAEEMIANMEPTAECKGHWIKASVARDGKFTITNGRNQFTKTYTPR